jgi:hypothetical protein
MTAQGAQADRIGSKYDEDARTATLKRAESYTLFRMIGALDGLRVLELARGFQPCPTPPAGSLPCAGYRRRARGEENRNRVCQVTEQR